MRNNSSGRATSPKPKEVKNKPVSTDLLRVLTLPPPPTGLTAPSYGPYRPLLRDQGSPHGPVCATRAGYPLHRENRKNGQKKIPVRENTGNLEILSKHREFYLNTGKRQGIVLGQVVKVPIHKVKYITIVAAKKSFFFPEAGKVCQVSSVYVILTNCVNWHGKFPVGQRKHREFKNTI